nr:hypothetical protein [Haliscomenobacter sp.]
MHADAGMVSAESYVGLVEVGIGVIPGGGGTKEFAVRASDEFKEGEVLIPTLIERFKAIATASVSTSAAEAFNYRYLLPERDLIVMNKDRAIAEAKKKVLELAPNYTQPLPKKVTVLGQTGLAALYVAANELKLGRYASEHDIKIAHKIAWVLCGGDLSGTQIVSEQYLLDLEREAFLSLCGEQKNVGTDSAHVANKQALAKLKGFEGSGVRRFEGLCPNLRTLELPNPRTKKTWKHTSSKHTDPPLEDPKKADSKTTVQMTWR